MLFDLIKYSGSGVFYEKESGWSDSSIRKDQGLVVSGVAGSRHSNEVRKKMLLTSPLHPLCPEKEVFICKHFQHSTYDLKPFQGLTKLLETWRIKYSCPKIHKNSQWAQKLCQPH